MIRSHTWVWGCLALLALVPLCRADESEDTLKSKDLAKVANIYVVPEEAAVLDGMRAIRQNKAKLEVELRQRASYEQKIASAKNFIKQCELQHDLLEERLATVNDPTIHNQIVGKMNLLLVKAKEAAKEQKDLEDKGGALGSERKADFVDQMMALDAKAVAANRKYADLAQDSDVKGAIDKINETAKPHVKLGPSPMFVTATNQLKLWRKDIEAETIPLTSDSGVNLVEVLLNGQPHKMVLDTGASLVTLPSELADELKMTPGPKDPPIQMKIADGNIIEGRLMVLKSVRVGRFTVQNVECVVLQKGLREAPALLGSSFLSHFVVKLDAHGGQLHLIELSANDKVVTTNGDKSDSSPSPAPRKTRDMTQGKESK